MPDIIVGDLRIAMLCAVAAAIMAGCSTASRDSPIARPVAFEGLEMRLTETVGKTVLEHASDRQVDNQTQLVDVDSVLRLSFDAPPGEAELQASPEWLVLAGALGCAPEADWRDLPADLRGGIVVYGDTQTGHYVHGTIDWHHFWEVVKGDGPCNRQRMATRVGAHETGTWVREAATAYAEKRAARAATESSAA